jgi:acyl carrier protein
MNTQQVYQQLEEIFREVFFVDDLKLKPETTAKDVAGWDSYKQIEILFAVEEKLGVRLNSIEIESLNNVGDLAAVIEKKSRR